MDPLPKIIHAASVTIPNHPMLLLYHRDQPGAPAENPGWFIGILVMVYYNPHITG